MKHLGIVSNSIIEKLRAEDFTRMVKSSYAPLRVEKWYGYVSNLQSIKDGRVNVEWGENFPPWLEELRVKFFPESNSALLCKGVKPNSDTSIDWHRDHGTFLPQVVMLNFGEVIFSLQTYDEGTIVKTIGDGEVWAFDSKLLHKSSQVSDERYIITFRKTKTEYTATKLF